MYSQKPNLNQPLRARGSLLKHSTTDFPQGIVLAPPDSPPQVLGDEPMQFPPLFRLG
jgi:hypothetical protein